MIFNLGLTANAAAAHESDLANSQTDIQRPSPSPSPSITFANLPSLGSIYNRYKGSDNSGSHQRQHPRGSMPTSPVESVSSIDADYSAIGSGLGRPRAATGISRSQSVRKSSSRPKTSYQLAHPASHARHRRLKLRPKLLLQLQQVSRTPRPQPVLDVLPSTVHLPRLARKFPTIFRGKNGLGPNDLIVVKSDLYQRPTVDGADKHADQDEDNNDHREVVATICQLLKEDALSKGKAEICLNYGPVWEATPLSNGSYEFMAHTDHGIQLMRWVLRGGKNRRTSAPPGSIQPEDSKRFTFSVIDPNTRRHPVIATMTRNHLEVMEEYSMPAPSSAPSTSPVSAAVSVVSDGSELDTPFERDIIAMNDNLRTLIVITSIWVAFREGWSHNFRYDDSGLALNSKAVCSPMASRHGSPTTARAETGEFPEERDSYPNESLQNGSRHRMSTSNVRASGTPSPSDRVKSIATGSLNKRSNSTGAAFIERSNRRVSGSGNRFHRNSPDKPLRPNGHVRQPEVSLDKGLPDAGPNCSKDKRRRRLSSIFSIFGKRTGVH
ncbi:hypothetical protein ASPWEDRAFT_102365 [Aspergillus wentii DTO 134E9]|uniref:Uncharacterized protein n=1 Tax=Aspergillus wentii DTO 134E9 TaxID=1073089 RepID=A0A1L9S0H0_ASPWE|nr:uncharacterized protein ASPWEDRAFT_102365 [Aspergillus wentii DTO 134E9]OJJ40608.1 hypothetical protein ASPWEDRAFT_102365 [Aspergillus wentii DTO 134E9]